MDKEITQPSDKELAAAIESHKFDDVRKVFAAMYAYFEKNKFDTLILCAIRETIDRNQDIKKIAQPDFAWRLFLEYALLHIPDDKIIIRKLLIERIRHSWGIRRIIYLEEKYTDQRMQAFQKVINNGVREVFGQLIHYNVVDKSNTLEDGSLISDEIDGNYDFGRVNGEVLLWKKNADELSRAIYQVWLTSSYEEKRAYDIILKIASSGKVKLQHCKWQSVQDILGELISQQIEVKKSNNDPALISILSLLLQDILPQRG